MEGTYTRYLHFMVMTELCVIDRRGRGYRECKLQIWLVILPLFLLANVPLKGCPTRQLLYPWL